MRKFTHVKVYKTRIGKQCMHCGRPANTTARRHTNGGKVLFVNYCDEHRQQLIEAVAPIS